MAMEMAMARSLVISMLDYSGSCQTQKTDGESKQKRSKVICTSPVRRLCFIFIKKSEKHGHLYAPRDTLAVIHAHSPQATLRIRYVVQTSYYQIARKRCFGHGQATNQMK